MALSILKYRSCSSENCHFRADIGTNAFYRYVIGESKTQKNNLPLVDDITHRSNLFQVSETGVFDSSFPLEISTRLFSNRQRYVQLLSYKDPLGRSQAFSEVVEVLPMPDLPMEFTPLPAISFTKAMNTIHQNNHEPYCRSVSYSYVQSPMSQTMFWETLLEAARVLAPTVVGAIGGLLNNGSAGGSGGGSTPNTQQILDIVTRIIGTLQQPSTPPTTAPATPAVAAPAPAVAAARTQSFSGGLSYKSLSSGNLAQKSNKNAYGKAMIIDGGILTGPLLASLLGPILQQAPQLLQTVLDSPVKLFNAITARRLGQQQLEQGYLERLAANLNQRALLEQLASSGLLAQQAAPVAMSFSASSKISIDFVQNDAMQVQGKPKFVYQTASPIHLKMMVSSGSQQANNKPIPKVIVQLLVKDSVSLQVLLEKKYKIKDVMLGSTLDLDLSVEELNKLPKNKDLLIGANFVWQTNSSSKNIGTYSNSFIFLTDGYLLKQFGNSVSEEKPLNDVTTNRVFWHKIWEGGGNRRRWELELDCKYLCVYKYNSDTNGRMETRMQMGEDASTDEGEERLKLIGKMKSGMEMSPVELNRILPTIGNYPSLLPEQLKALMTDELEKSMNQEANVRIELKGKRDERGVLWAYPELTVHEVLLQKVSNFNQNGQVTATIDETVYFPRVSSYHFIGAKTDAQ